MNINFWKYQNKYDLFEYLNIQVLEQLKYVRFFFNVQICIESD